MLDYVCGHLPAGTVSTAIFEGGISGPGIPENAIGAFAVPGHPGTLVIETVRLPDGSTGLRAEAYQVVVLNTSSGSSETLPAGTHLLRIVRRDIARGCTEPESEQWALLERLPREVTSVGRIEAAVALLNKLAVAQPGIRLCPLSRVDGSVELSFYASRGAAPVGHRGHQNRRVRGRGPDACRGPSTTA